MPSDSTVVTGVRLRLDRPWNVLSENAQPRDTATVRVILP